MAKKAFNKDEFLLDWRTGRYNGRTGIEQLARKYGISKSKAYTLVNGVEKDLSETINQVVAVTQELNTLSDEEFKVVQNHASRETKLKDRRDKIVHLAWDAMEERLLDPDKRKELSTYDIKTLVDANDKNCVTAEIAPRFASNGGVTVNANAQAGVQQRTITFEVLDARNNKAN